MKKDKFKSGAIVKYKGVLGTLLSWGQKTHFLESGIKNPQLLNNLPVVTPDDVSETSMDEKIIHLKMDCRWGTVKAHYIIRDGEYIILKVMRKDKPEQYYHEYLNFKDTGHGSTSFDGALIGLLTIKYQGGESQAGMMFERMLRMGQEKEGQ